MHTTKSTASGMHQCLKMTNNQPSLYDKSMTIRPCISKRKKPSLSNLDFSLSDCMINSSSKKFVHMWPPWKTAWVFECLMTQSYNRNSQLRSLPSYNYYATSLNIIELRYLKAFQTKPLKALLRSLFPNRKNCAHCTTITDSWRIRVIRFYWSNICKKSIG